MKALIGPLAAMAILAAPALAADTEGPWIADFDKAAAAAEKSGKDLFVDFTGSDW